MGLGQDVGRVSRVPTMSIRRAGVEDLEWLIVELRKFAAFFGTKKSIFGPEEYVRSALALLIEKQIVFVAERIDVGPMGFVAGLLQPHTFNPEVTVLSELFWWVKEEHRGSRAAAMLLKAFVNFGKANADWITFGLEVHSPVNANALVKRGFKLQERAFLMETT